MSNAEETSSGNRRNLMNDRFRTMEQHFARMEIIYGEIRDRLERQGESIANLQRARHNPRRHDRRRGVSMDEYESEEDEVGGSEEEFEYEYEVGRNRHRGERYMRRHGRNIPRERNRVDGNLGSIKMKSDFCKKLQELKQGSMSVEEYFQEMELAMIRACVKETPKATKDRFIHGLNPEIVSFARSWSFMDFDILVPLVAKHEQRINQKRRSKSSSNSKEIETITVTVPDNKLEVEPTKEEEEELNAEHQVDKCEEDLIVESTNLVVEENSLNLEKKSENDSESVFSETVLERKIVIEGEKEIESLECFQNKESKNESVDLNEIKDKKSCEKSEVKSDYKDTSLVTNDLNYSFPRDFGLLQVLGDLFPKKPPDGFLSSRRIEPLSHSSDDSRTNPFEERGNDAIQDGFSTFKDPLQIPSGPITRARAKRIKEAMNGLVQETLAKQMAIGATNQIKNAEDVINFICAENRVAYHILGLETSN